MHLWLPIMLVWLLLLGVSSVATAEREDRILARGELQVCIWPDYYGISYRDPRTGQLRGIDVDLAWELASDLGVNVAFVDSSFATLIEDVLSERCDIAMFGIGITPERSAHLRFTQPHLLSDIYGITTRVNRLIEQWSDIDRPGVLVGVTRGTYHETVMRQRLRHAELVVIEPGGSRELELEAGRIDVFMTDYPYSRRLLDTVHWARLIEPPEPFHLTPYGYALKPGDVGWYRRVEEFMHAIKRDGRLRTAAERYYLKPIIVLDNG